MFLETRSETECKLNRNMVSSGKYIYADYKIEIICLLVLFICYYLLYTVVHYRLRTNFQLYIFSRILYYTSVNIFNIIQYAKS